MNAIIDSDTAVQSYIDELLFAGVVAPELEPQSPRLQTSQAKVFSDTVGDVKPADPTQAADIGFDLDTLDNDALEAPQKAIDSPFLKQFAMAQKRLQRSKHARSQDSYPEWATERFKCVIFKVANLKLALPLAVVSGMYPLKTSSLKPIDGSSEPDEADIEEVNDASSWRLGTMPAVAGEEGCIDIIDTARLVMPERYSAAMPENYRLVLAINNCNWGFAVDSVGGEVEFEAQKVRWRSEHTRREWLAGTVVDKMCAIVDIEVINRHLLADSILSDADDTEH